MVECAGELDQAQVEFGSETIMKQVEHGFQRYIRLDPWNVLDVIVAIGFCGIFVVRLIGVDVSNGCVCVWRGEGEKQRTLMLKGPHEPFCRAILMQYD